MTANENNHKGVGERLRAILSSRSKHRLRRASPPSAPAGVSRNDERERMMETVSRLAGGVAHDLNNIMLVIQGYTEMALAEEDAGPSVRDLLAEVKEATSRAGRILQDLLILGQRGPFRPRLLDVEESVRRLAPAIQEECGPDIRVVHKSGPDQLQILADEEMIGKLLLAFAARARAVMPGGGTLTLAASREREGRIVLSATDTGDALSEKELARLFEPYLPGPTGGKGRGMGLSLVDAIARRCAGSVSAESSPGTGTTLRVSFPGREASPLPLAAPQSAPVAVRSAPPDPVPSTGISILIAEDDDGLRAMATKILAREGYVVLAARDGLEAVELFERERGRIRLVVLDDVMPRMGGRAALERMRENGASVPAILCSGYTWSLDGQNHEVGGFSSILPKPWQPRELLRCVREGLETAR